MFERIVDGLFTYVDLDGSNDLDEDEFDHLLILLGKLPENGSTYQKAFQEVGKKLNFKDACLEPKSEADKDEYARGLQRR
jgi:hypothetical protein